MKRTTSLLLSLVVTGLLLSTACLVRESPPGIGPSGGALRTPGFTVKVLSPRADAPSGLPLPTATGISRPNGKPGNLTVLDWAGFKAAVTYTFDDTNSSQMSHYPELRALGVRMTFYLITSKPEAADPVWATVVKDGHEIGNHSATHPHTGSGADLDAATAFLRERLGVTPWTMAAPFGDASYRALATSRFLLNRSVGGGVIRPNDTTDPFVLPCFVPPRNAPAAEFDGEVEAARSAGGWAIVLVHGFIGGTDGAFQAVRIEDFTTAVAHARAHDDLWIDSLVNVGSYWSAQRLLTAATPVAAAGRTTWSWTLPPHFPPHQYVRVKVDGGTLSQHDQPLPWDDHGYYEVALDAGSLTLGP